LRSLAPDDAGDLIQNAPGKEHSDLLAALDPSPRAVVSALLREDGVQVEPVIRVENGSRPKPRKT